MSCRTEIELAVHTGYLTQSQTLTPSQPVLALIIIIMMIIIIIINLIYIAQFYTNGIITALYILIPSHPMMTGAIQEEARTRK